MHNISNLFFLTNKSFFQNMFFVVCIMAGVFSFAFEVYNNWRYNNEEVIKNSACKKVIEHQGDLNN